MQGKKRGISRFTTFLFLKKLILLNPPCFFLLLKIPNISIKESLLACMLTSYSESPKAITISVSGDGVGGRAWGGKQVKRIYQS